MALRVRPGQNVLAHGSVLRESETDVGSALAMRRSGPGSARRRRGSPRVVGSDRWRLTMSPATGMPRVRPTTPPRTVASSHEADGAWFRPRLGSRLWLLPVTLRFGIATNAIDRSGPHGVGGAPSRVNSVDSPPRPTADIARPTDFGAFRPRGLSFPVASTSPFAGAWQPSVTEATDFPPVFKAPAEILDHASIRLAAPRCLDPP